MFILAQARFSNHTKSQSFRFFRMPRWRRRHGHLIGRFFEEWVEDGQSEGSVPDVGSSDTDSDGGIIGGWGRQLYCGYRSRCGNDTSEQRYRWRICKVLCCEEDCLARPNGVCRHCKEAWPDASWNLPEFLPEEFFGSVASSGGSSGSSDRIGNTLPHHNRQRSRSRSPASNLVGSCPICLERPKDHCLVPCGHRTCLQCGSRCLPICPQCRGTCTQCMRVFD